MIVKCVAIIICESVVEDMRSRNKCILNAYNTIFSPAFPARHDRLTVFASLTEGRGTQPVKLAIVKADGSNEVLFGMDGHLTFDGPVQVVDLVCDIRQLVMPAPGPYEVQVWVGGELVGQRRFQAVLAKANQ